MIYLHFAYAIGGRPFDSEGGLENAENNLSSSVKEINNLTLSFLQFGGGGVSQFSLIFLLALLATVKFSNIFAGSIRLQF